MEKQKREAEAEAKSATKAAVAAPTQERRQSRPPKLTYAQKKELEKIDSELPKLNARKAEIEALLSGGESDPQKVADLSAEYQQVQSQVDDMEMRWLELQEIIEG